MIEVPVPSGVPSNVAVPYTVEPAGSSPVLGRQTGLLPSIGPDSGRIRSVLVTFSVPKHAPAGMVEVARVRFSPPGTTPIEVPVNVIVEPTQQIQLTVGEGLHGVRPGDRFNLTFRVTNLGNTPELVDVRAVLPVGWSVVIGARPTRLGINGMTEQQLTIAVPFNAGTGSSSVRLIAYVAGAPVATTEALVDVVTSRDRQNAGPVVSTALAFGWDPSGQSSSGFTVGVEGRLTDSLQISARMSSTPPRSGAGSYALSQVGFYQTPPMLQLTAPHWGLGLGLTGMQFTQLTGVGLNGEGISASVNRNRWRAAMMVAHPGYGAMPDSGLFAGGRVEFNQGAVLFSGAATHLLDMQGTSTRQLDALSLGATVANIWSGTFGTELAERWTAQGASPGWSMNYDRRVASNNVSVKVLHAPGGGGAFAQATDQLFASAGHSVTRQLSFNGSYSMSSDNSGLGFGSLRTHSWSGGPQLQVNQALGISLSGRQSEFSAAGSNGSFSNSEQGFDGAATFRAGRMFVSSFGSMVKATNETTTPGGGYLMTQGLRSTINGILGINTNRGTIQLDGQLTRSSPGSGQIPEQANLGVRVDQVPVVTVRAVQLYLTGSIRRTYAPGFMAARTYETIGMTAALPMGFSIGVSAQRNPFLLAGTSSGGWLYGLRVGRGTSLPRLSTTESRGVVYKDLNSNGKRDPGEPGVDGVVVRRGFESVVTEHDGSFRFLGVTRDSLNLDPSSLKVGIIAGTARQNGDLREIAVVAVSPVEVQLVRSGDELVQSDSTTLAAVVVMAKDADGKYWVARRSSITSAVFDALPPGNYTIEVDLADLQEKLETRQVTHTFLVSGSVAVAPIRLVLYARPLNLKKLVGNVPLSGGGTIKP